MKKFTVIGIYGDNNQIVADEVEAINGTEALQNVLELEDDQGLLVRGNPSYRAVAAVEHIPGVELNISYND